MSDSDSFILRDSGERESFPTGAARDSQEGKGRYDLISPFFLRRLAKVLERGAKKYSARNWEKGMPLERFINSTLRHICQLMEGDAVEDHAAQAAWNLHAFIHTAERIERGELPAALDSIGYTSRPSGPEKTYPIESPATPETLSVDRVAALLRLILSRGSVEVNSILNVLLPLVPWDVVLEAKVAAGIEYSHDGLVGKWALPSKMEE